MPITIFYCVTCNYLSQATQAAEALREALGVQAVLVRGHSGRFEVEVNGTVVLAKGKGGLPTPRDVVEAVARALGRLQSVAH
ncbi:MAG: Rdx family protein [Myxococcaceae bacterium]